MQIPIELAKEVHWNLSGEELIAHALRNNEGVLASNGALVAYTGKYTGRTPNDKFIVREPSMEEHIWWDKNRAMEPEVFQELLAKAHASLPGKRLYVVDAYGGADPEHRISVRFVVENAYHALFIRTLLIRPTPEQMKDFKPDWVALNLSREKWEREEEGKTRDAVIALNFGSREILIMGTEYAGEMKKSIFTVLNGILPLKGVMSMHCSANMDTDRSGVALYFGLSGTGKTTLSANPRRPLIGDDEHGWDEKGVFNFEGGCYAKCIDLTEEKEPQIWAAIRRGSVLENVVLDDEGNPVYSDRKWTENTRCAYPIDFIPRAVEPSVGGHPEHIFFLTCDANGVLPPISRLDCEQMMHYFVNGYTAKMPGTEVGLDKPKSNFSTCFGAPFLPLKPLVYAELLAKKVKEKGAKVWLINTGWTGGPYGEGQRISLPLTRAMVDAALDGLLDHVPYRLDPILEIEVPTEVPGIPPDVLNPRDTWKDKDAFDEAAKRLEGEFEANYEKLAGPWIHTLPAGQGAS